MFNQMINQSYESCRVLTSTLLMLPLMLMMPSDLCPLPLPRSPLWAQHPEVGRNRPLVGVTLFCPHVASEEGRMWSAPLTTLPSSSLRGETRLLIPGSSLFVLTSFIYPVYISLPPSVTIWFLSPCFTLRSPLSLWEQLVTPNRSISLVFGNHLTYY